MLISSRRWQSSTLRFLLGRSLGLCFLLLSFGLGQARGAIAFVQTNSATPQTPQTTVAVVYTLAQTAGNLNVVVVGWNDSTATVSSVVDSKGNTYALAAVPVVQTGTATQAIYYAKNIVAAAAGTNSVTVTFSVAARFSDIRIAEYSGLDQNNPLDVSVGAQGTTTATSNSGSVTTTNANDLLVGANLVQSTSTSAGTSYTSRGITQDGDILEDRVVTATGSYSATANLDKVQQWVMQMVAFKAAGSGGSTPSITSLNPTSGQVGTSVTITGANFGSSQGTSTVAFNTTAAGSATTWNATTIVIPVPSGATTGNVVVTVGGVASNGVAFTVTGPPASITATAGTPQSATINAAFATQLQATVRDAGNNPVSGVVVTFTAPTSGASGTFAGGVNTATTNASGVATAPVFTANSIAGGPYTVTATVAGVATPANFSLTNKAGAAAKVAVTSGSGQSAPINTAFGAPLVATVTDAGNNPVSGVVVTFTAPGSGASGTFAGGVNTATTNASGVATSAVFTANSTAGGPYNVVASATGATSANFALTNTVGSAAKVAVTSGSGQSAAINTAFGAPLVATVTDSGNNPVSGVVVTFTAPGSGASGTFAGGVNTATTNASGVATSATFTANATVGGPYNVVASATGATSANFSLTNLAALPAKIVVTSGSGQSAAINTAFGAPLVATVTDAGNNPVSGIVVTFTAPTSGASGTFAGGVNTATTNASGVATSATFTANSTAGGPYNVAASVSGVATAANFSFTNLVGQAAKVAVTSGSGQSAAINTAFGAPLVATVTDAGNNPVSGVVVTFTAPGSGASGTFAGGVNTATTNVSGVATSAVFTANSTAGGPYNVVASATGATSANFSLTNTAGAAASITATAGTPQSATVNTAFATQLQATVKDAGNNPVSGVVVTFTAPGSGASGTFAGGVNTATTNASGVATSASFTANATAGGPYTVTATVVGVTTPANFSLTNLAAAAIAFVQSNSATPQTPQTTVTVAYNGAQAAGDLNVVIVGWNDSTATISSVTDAKGNTYAVAAVPVVQTGTATQAIYYAKNIVAAAAGTNTVTVTFNVAANFADIRIAEYSGLDQNNPLDVSVGAQGTTTATSNSGSVTTTNANDLLVGGNVVQSTTISAGSGNTSRGITQDGDILEDRVVTATGSYSATANLDRVQQWVMQMAAFRAAGGTGGTSPSITSLNPTSGQAGTSVTITGANFGSSQGTSTVTFNTTAAGSATTWNATTIVIPVPSGATTGNVVVTVGGVASNGVAFTVTGPPASITATAGTPQSATINTAFAAQLQATVRDAANNPVNGVVVTFTAPTSGASGTFAGGVNTATTNASGVATSAVFTANSIAGGPYTVTATVAGVAAPANFSLTNKAGAAAKVAVTIGSGQSAPINTAFGAPLVATVTDAGNNPVSGVVVTFTAPASGASGTFAGGVNTATTNGSGVATSAVFTANSTAGGPYSVVASATGATSANFALTNTVGSAAKVTVTSGSGQSATINTAFGAPLVATVTDAGNNPVSGVVVTFTAPASGASGTFAGGVNTATTNASGVATSAAFTANATVGGPYNVVASTTGATSANFSLTNLSAPPAKIVVTSGSGQSAPINTAFAAPLVATVTDAGNNPVSGVVVTFTAPASGASGTFAGGVNTATTNGSGVATSAVFTANATAGGAYTVTATVAGVATPANFSLTNTAGAAAKVAVTSGSGQSAAINTAFGAPLVATVTDSGNNPVSGVVVTFTAPGSGASGTFAGGVNTATTNASGVATSAVFTANITAGGPYNVVASATGATSANFSLTNLAGAAASITVTAGTPQSATVNTAFATQLQATVKDAGNNPVSGVVVTFTAPTSGASGTFAGGVNTATTNASGVATSATFTANATAGGPYTVTATVVGVTTPANFSLTNLPAAAIAFVQSNSATPQTPQTTVTVAYNGAQTAGDLNVVIVGWNDSTATISSVTDGKGNTYAVAAVPVVQTGTATQAIYYAKNIVAAAAGTNSVTVTFSVAARFPDIRIAEYSGIDPVNALDVSAGAQGTTTATSNSGFAITTNAHDLLVSGNVVQSSTISAGSGYTSRGITADGDILEDQVVTATASYSATANLDKTQPWIMQMAAFRATGGTGGLVPNITSLNPTSGQVGTSITITGTNFGSSQGTSTVTFNGTAGIPTSWGNTTIVVPVPANATSGNVIVTVNGILSNGSAFTVTAAPPSITTLNPTSGALGSPVTISGANFGTSQGSSTVTFNGVTATPTSWGASSITAPVPNGALTGNVVVAVGGVASNGVPFTVTNPGPSLSTLGLTQGPIGAIITITGVNFGATQGTSTVTFGTTTAAPTSWSSTSIDVPVPSMGLGTVNVVVTVGGVASNPLPFTVTPPPNITSISPISGPVGTVVTITGTNFGPTVGTRVSTVSFNGVVGRTTSWSDTSIVLPVPVGATTGNVVVSISGVSSNGVLYTVTLPPSITSVSPTSGAFGAPVTITGTNFGPTQNNSTVRFNGTLATPTSWSDTSIVVPVPSASTSGNIVVTVGGVASNGVNFIVTSSIVPITLIQHTGLDAGITSSASLAFPANNTAGNWIVVCIRAATPSQVFTVSDTKGNTYQRAISFNEFTDGMTLGIYYAENIAGGSNTVTVSDTTSAALRFAILEYAGIATSNSLDGVPTGAYGTSAFPSSGNMTTLSNGDLVLGNISTANPNSFAAGTGFTGEQFVPALPNTKLLAEDMIQTAAGAVSASATLNVADQWAAAVAAFRAASAGAPPPIAVSISPTTVSVATGATQGFTATVRNDTAQRGVTFSLSGPGCSGNACGLLTNVTPTSVTYTGPTSVPSPATATLTATSVSDNTKSSTATITVTQGTLTVTVSPRRGSITASQTQQFTATVFNDPTNSGVTWQVDGNTGGNATTGTISTSGLFTPGTQAGLHTITATSVANASVNTSVSFAVTDLLGVYTYHNDVAHTGQNLQEYALTPSNVNSSTFSLLYSCPVDGFVYGQPLYVANLTVGSVTRNVVFIVTEHDSVYAFDADSPSCIQLWKTSFLGTGVTTMPYSDTGNPSTNDVFPEIGITSTPVIDPATNTIYVEAKTKETVGTGCSAGSPCFVHRLHALNITTGAEKLGGPVVITAPNFNSQRHFNRPSLLLANSTVYVAFGSHGDICNWQGWLFGYDAATLAQKFVFPTSDPTTGCNGASIWDGGAGPAADANGNLYITTGNGSYDGTKNWSESAMKFSPTGTLLDWFTPFNRATLDANDVDMGSTGTIVLPDVVGSTAHPHLAIATGKIAILYLLDRDNMGKFTNGSNKDVQEVIPVPPPNTTQLDGGNYGVLAYWNGNIYSTGQNFPLSQFKISNGTITTPQFAVSNNLFPPRGATPAVSASGTTNGIVWVLDLTGWGSGTNAILDAYDANNVGNQLFSSPATGTGSAGAAVKFTVPTVANGKVYVSGESSFSVFGLLP